MSVSNERRRVSIHFAALAGRPRGPRHLAAHGGKLLRNPDVTRVSTGASILTDPAEPGMITGW